FFCKMREPSSAPAIPSTAGISRIGAFLMSAYLNKIATAVPTNDVHATFIEFADRLLEEDRRGRALFRRMADRGQVDHRWSCLSPAQSRGAAIDDDGFYTLGSFPSTGERMARYERDAPALAATAVERLQINDPASVTHLIIISCTGLSAPGLDFDLIARFGLNPSIECTMVGFMGCYAAINGVKLARHIVRSDRDARVLVISLELCTLHLQDTRDLEQVLTFMIFGDGCASALVTADPAAFSLDSFHAVLVPHTS